MLIDVLHYPRVFVTSRYTRICIARHLNRMVTSSAICVALQSTFWLNSILVDDYLLVDESYEEFKVRASLPPTMPDTNLRKKRQLAAGGIQLWPDAIVKLAIYP